MKNLDPMSDLVFKAIFGKDDKESKGLLMALLNDILAKDNHDPIIDIVHMNPFNYKDFEEDKLSILDIRARTDMEEMINIEVQVRKEDNYRKRSLYYWSKTYGDTIADGETYDSLKKTIVINILGYTEIKESNMLHTTFKILEKDEHFVLLEDFQIHYLELPKFPRREIEELDGVELWLDFLKEAGKDGNEDRLIKLMGRNEIMSNAVNKFREISADERMRELYRTREKTRLDMISKLKYAENRGRQEGMIELAKELIEDNIDIEFIAKYTKLTVEELNEIKKDIKH